MNFSEIRPQVYTYLGYTSFVPDEETDDRILRALTALDALEGFRYLYRAYTEMPAFLRKSPYEEFLRGCGSVVLCVTTLGAEADKRIKLLARTDMTESVIWDACASALLEARADAYEKNFGEDRTYRFCPGYGGTSVADVRPIFEAVRPERIGVTLDDSNYILPSKSMAGIVGIGKRAEKTCGDCMLRERCGYRKEGTRCYDSAKK